MPVLCVAGSEYCNPCPGSAEITYASEPDVCKPCPVDASADLTRTICSCVSYFYAVSSFEILELIDPEAAEAYEVDYGTVGEETSDSSVFDPHKELGFWCARCPVGICVWCRCCARATCNLIDAGICVR